MNRKTISRPLYLEQLIERMGNDLVKIITGVRRCGKSFLLDVLFRDYLKSIGVKDEQIITIKLDLAKDIKYRNPLLLSEYVRGIVESKKEDYFIFIDEIQLSDTVENPYYHSEKKITFYDALNDLNSLPNLDIYVTGSNSKMLSSDILTEFRGRGDEIRVYPPLF